MKNVLKVLSAFLAVSLYGITLGAGTVQKFDIQTTPNKVQVGESVDLTIKALDKDGNVVKNYVGEVLIFSQSDPKAEFPGVLTENTYKFKATDSGLVKFENAVKFTKAGTQDINVYDTSDENVFGLAEVEVGGTTAKTSSGEISITSPESGTTIGADKVKVSGTSLKNHKIKIVLNSDKEFDTTTNAEGTFEYELTGLKSGENSVKAKLLDADLKVMGESTQVSFKVESNTPKFKSIKVTPEGEITGETQLNVELEATAGLTSVDLVLNDIVQKLTETSKQGVYTGTITSPKDNGDYKIDVILKNELGLETKQSGVTSITVKNVELAAAPVEETATGTTTSTGVNCDEIKKELIIKNIKLVKMKSKSVLSWDKVEKATSYNLYKKDKTGTGMTLIQNLTDTQVEINIEGNEVSYDDFAVKAVLKNESCEIESANYSDMTKVQTGPREVLLIVLSLLMVSGIFYLRRKNA